MGRTGILSMIIFAAGCSSSQMWLLHSNGMSGAVAYRDFGSYPSLRKDIARITRCPEDKLEILNTNPFVPRPSHRVLATGARPVDNDSQGIFSYAPAEILPTQGQVQVRGNDEPDRNYLPIAAPPTYLQTAYSCRK